MTKRIAVRELEENRKDWDALVRLHMESRFYGVERFLNGGTALGSIEQREVGPVRGCSLLHLQCHIGIDTLSWARKGANVTGVDFSTEAIRAARDLAARTGLSARFVPADVYHLPESLKGKFDIVFSSWGVIAWLPDMEKWARAAAGCLQKGGFLYLLDIHPLVHLFDDSRTVKGMKPAGSYFHEKVKLVPESGSYATDYKGNVTFPRHQWQESLQDVIRGIIRSGLVIEDFSEHEVMPHKHLPFMRRLRNGYWAMPETGPRIPLSFSIKARKPSG